MADITAQLAKLLYDRCGGHSELVTEIVKDISRENLSESSKTTNAVRNLSHFIVGDNNNNNEIFFINIISIIIP